MKFWKCVNALYCRDELMPIIREKKPETKIILTSAAGRWNFTDMSPVFKNWTDSDWKRLVDRYNYRFKQIIKDSKIENLEFLSSNGLTIKSPDGDVLTVDHIHKMQYVREKTPPPGKKIPDSLKADTDVILNYYCNSRLEVDQQDGENLCCDL